MTINNSDEKELVRAMKRNENAEYIEKYIKEPLKEETTRYDREKPYFSASDDHLMLLIFTYIDALGYLSSGSNQSTTKNAVEFMRKYLGRIDKRYKEISGLLYNALRHGMVHLATPKRIKLIDGAVIDFLFNRSGQRENHLKVIKPYPAQTMNSKINYNLSLDLSILYYDLLSAIDEYARDIKENQKLSDIFELAFKTRRDPEKAKEKELLNKYKSYMRESDFSYVRDQIERLKSD